jgi:tetrahydromethanopterin S-methyltransferase subunit G
MSDDPDKNVLDYLRAQFDRMHVRFDKLDAEIGEIKHRLTAVEIQVGNLSATEANHYGATMLRLDRVDQRLDRIERRLDLVDTPAA